MALPISKSVKQLRKLRDPKLQTYFEEHAQYSPDSPPNRGYSYAIRFGSRCAK